MFILGMAVLILSLAFTGCKEDDGPPATNGKVTITGLGTHNGKYVAALASVSGVPIFSAAGSNGKAVKIENGTADLKVWTVLGNKPFGYSGNDQNQSFVVYILNSSTLNPSAYINAHAYGYIEVDFSNGDGGSESFNAY